MNFLIHARYAGMLVIIFLFSQCNFGGKKLSSKIENTKTESHTRILSSGVYVKLPAGFKLNRTSCRYEKSDSLYFQVVESNTSNFVTAKANFTEESFKKRKIESEVLQSLKLDSYEAIYCTGPSNVPNQKKSMFLFGDDKLLIMIVAVSSNSDSEGNGELKDILESIYYDKDFKADPMEIASFEFDQTITAFKYSSTVPGLYLFSEHGKEDSKKPTANSVQILTLPSMTEEKANAYAKQIPGRCERNGFKLANKTIAKSRINNCDLYFLKSEISYGKSTGVMLQAFLNNEKSSALFIGNAFTDTAAFAVKYKNTIESIKLR